MVRRVNPAVLFRKESNLSQSTRSTECRGKRLPFYSTSRKFRDQSKIGPSRISIHLCVGVRPKKARDFSSQRSRRVVAHGRAPLLSAISAVKRFFSPPRVIERLPVEFFCAQTPDPLRAPGGSTAVEALVTRSVPYHDGSAVGAGRRIRLEVQPVSPVRMRGCRRTRRGAIPKRA